VIPAYVLPVAQKSNLTPLAPIGEIPRSNVTGTSRENSSSVNAVLLGVLGGTTLLVSMFVSAPASAQAPTSNTSNEDQTAKALFAQGSVKVAANEDPNVRELTTKVGRLVDRQFDGSMRAAFDHYAGADGKVSRDELSDLLSDAHVGNFVTRGAWVSGIMDRLDKAPNGNGDGKVSWTEFSSVMATGNA